ncbi:MAG: hypothetical protein A2W23_04405 [Planctomycetes bacterium RBG_16_43_13]|nr:MAG: hypothetical protein A2W23_04405 [Planctomycetes bacterium RBG_16_43_13]
MVVSRRRPSVDNLISHIGRGHGNLIGNFSGIVIELKKIILNNSTNNHTSNHITKSIYERAEIFRTKLVRHIQYEDNVVIPAIKQTCPEAEPRLNECVEDHNKLRKLTNDLCTVAQEIKADAAKLSNISRLILASLLQHINDEDNFFMSLLVKMNRDQLGIFYEKLKKFKKIAKRTK